MTKERRNRITRELLLIMRILAIALVVCLQAGCSNTNLKEIALLFKETCFTSMDIEAGMTGASLSVTETAKCQEIYYNEASTNEEQ